MNIYQMYHHNNMQFGFYVIRDSWATVIAKIIEIEGVEEGKPIPGKFPYFKNQTVIASFYKVDNTEDDAAAVLCMFGKNIGVDKISCPGSYAYRFAGTDSFYLK